MGEKRSNKVCAVIVTYNRKELLKEVISAIVNQTYQPEKILVINNASTDDTADMVDKEFGYVSSLELINMESNLGGAGGFYEGIKLAQNYNCDWSWIMDDDAVPDQDALEQLLRADDLLENNHNSFYASIVYGMNGEPMNVPEVYLDTSENGYPEWQYYLAHSLVRIKIATFVSLLISGKAVEKVGLPCKDFFIWGDDSEYTFRLTKYYGPAYLVGNSKVIHKRIGTSSINIHTEPNVNRIKMYHYQYRNKYIFERFYKTKKLIHMRWLAQVIYGLKLLTEKNGILKFKSYEIGLFEGITQYKKISDFIIAELKQR